MYKTNEINVKEVINVLEEFLIKKKGETQTVNKETDIRTKFQLDDLDIMELVMEFEDEFKTNINDEEIAVITESHDKITPTLLTELVNKSLNKKINAVLI